MTALVFTKPRSTVRLADDSTIVLQGGDPVVPAALAAGELERLVRLNAVGHRFVRPAWLSAPALQHRRSVQRAMGLPEEDAPPAVSPLPRVEIDNCKGELASLIDSRKGN